MARTIKTASTPRPGATTVSDLAREAEERGRSLLDEGAELGTAMLAVVQDNAVAFFDEQRDRAASEIGALGEFLHNSVDAMQRREGVVARCADEAASQIDGFADWLRGRSWRELTGDVEDLARRYPLSFLGAAAGAGFLAVRLLTASGEETHEQSKTARHAGHGARAAKPGDAEVVASVSGGSASGHGAGGAGEN